MALQIIKELGGMAPAGLLDNLTQEMCQNLSLQIAAQIRSVWVNMANEAMTTSATDYTNGIQEARLEGQGAVVSLLGEKPNRLEHGEPAYDMRDRLLGPGVPIVSRGSGQRGKQQTKATGAGAGYYRSIPFRHQTPGKTGAPSAMRLAKPMGHAYQRQMGVQEAHAMGKAIHAAAKRLAPTVTEPHRLHSSATPSGKRAKDFRGTAGKMATMQRPIHGARLPAGVGGAKKLRPHHSTDIYAGMQKMQDTYRQAVQNTYMTFRTISTRKTTGWQHPGSPGAQLMRKLDAELPELAKEVFAAFAYGAQGLAP